MSTTPKSTLRKRVLRFAVSSVLAAGAPLVMGSSCGGATTQAPEPEPIHTNEGPQQPEPEPEPIHTNEGPQEQPPVDTNTGPQEPPPIHTNEGPQQPPSPAPHS